MAKMSNHPRSVEYLRAHEKQILISYVPAGDQTANKGLI